MNAITPVMLAGGTGTRLWPVSRTSFPKQFMTFADEHTLFQNTVQRVTSSTAVKFAAPIILTNSDFRFIVRDQLSVLDIDTAHIILEPEAKNTAASILAASLWAFEENSDATLLVVPTDHKIDDIEAFHKAIEIASRHVERRRIVTFGIAPTHPETGYGYLEYNRLSEDDGHEVHRFIEKPNKVRAEQMLKDGGFFWNSGIFMFKARDMIAEFHKSLPQHVPLVEKAVHDAQIDLGFVRVEPAPWSQLQDISIDFAIMEKAETIFAIPLSCHWSDLGNWLAVWENSSTEKRNVVLSENAYALDCQNSMFRNDSKMMKMIGIGVTDVFAIATQDAVLVVHKDSTQKVKDALSLVANERDKPYDAKLKDYRPWGWREVISSSQSSEISRVHLNPGAEVTMQSHSLRTEHWIVETGRLSVTINGETKIITQGESIFVPLNSLHQLSNITDEPTIVLEVKTGSYIGEDDIQRY